VRQVHALGYAAALALAACAHDPERVVAAGAGRFAGTYVCTEHSAHRLPHVAASGTLTIAEDGSYVRNGLGEQDGSRGWISSIHHDEGAPGPAVEFTSTAGRYRMESLDRGTRFHVTTKSMHTVDCVKLR
jgi:hypothetical protein